MKIITLLLVVVFYSQNIFAEDIKSTFVELKNFRIHSAQLSSSGLPVDHINQLASTNYQHVINLIPGDHSEEENLTTSLGMSYYQIEVDWENPKLSDFHQFAYYMSKFDDTDKTLIHCKLNYRASTFAYLYQVIVKEEPQSTAKEQLLSVWEPEAHWLKYMNTVLEYYDNIPNDTLPNDEKNDQ